MWALSKNALKRAKELQEDSGVVFQLLLSDQINDQTELFPILETWGEG